MLLFTILKVIGLVLLFLLLLILLLLGLVLLVPIRYAGAGHKGEEKKDYEAHVDVSWLLHIVQLHAGLTPAGLAYSLRILCFRPIDSRPPDTSPANASDETLSRGEEEPSTEGSAANASDESLSRSEAEPPTECSAANASDENSSRSEETTAPDDTAAKDSDEAPSEREETTPSDETLSASCEDSTVQDEDTDVSVKQSSEDEKTLEKSAQVSESEVESTERAAAQTVEVDSIELKNAAEAPEKKKRKKSSFADRIKRICEKLSSLREAVEDEENQKAFRLLISRVKYLLHHLRFRKFEGQLTFGFDDPAMMGRILAVFSLFYPLYGERFTITPVFDHTVFEGEVALKGHVRLIHILIAGIQLMMNKKIRGLVLDRI